MKLSYYFLIFIILISKAYADERVYVCKPLYASVLMENGHLYSESIDNMDEEAGLLSVGTCAVFTIRKSASFLRFYEYMRFLKNLKIKFPKFKKELSRRDFLKLKLFTYSYDN